MIFVQYIVIKTFDIYSRHLVSQYHDLFYSTVTKIKGIAYDFVVGIYDNCAFIALFDQIFKLIRTMYIRTMHGFDAKQSKHYICKIRSTHLIKRLENKVKQI